MFTMSKEPDEEPQLIRKVETRVLSKEEQRLDRENVAASRADWKGANFREIENPTAAAEKLAQYTAEEFLIDGFSLHRVLENPDLSQIVFVYKGPSSEEWSGKNPKFTKRMLVPNLGYGYDLDPFWISIVDVQLTGTNFKCEAVTFGRDFDDIETREDKRHKRRGKSPERVTSSDRVFVRFGLVSLWKKIESLEATKEEAREIYLEAINSRSDVKIWDEKGYRKSLDKLNEELAQTRGEIEREPLPLFTQNG